MNKSHIDSELYEILHFTPEPSSEVQNKIDNAYKQIRNGKVQINSKINFRRILYPGIAAAIIIGLGFLGFSNLSLAAKLPFIGRIFSTIESDVGYPGNYSDYATAITAPENNNTPQSDTNTNKSPENDADSDLNTNAYSQTSGGITITLSEVVCTDMSLYLSLEIYNEEEFPEDFNLKKNREGYIWSYNVLYMQCGINFDFIKNDVDLPAPYIIEGDYVDSHTFLGIVRVDMDAVRNIAEIDTLPQEFTYSINISRLWGLLNELTESQLTNPITGETRTVKDNHKRYEGIWNFTVPVTMNNSDTQVKEIMETNEDGIGISTVTKTRYEISAELILPDVKDIGDYIVVITDADGNILDSQGIVVEIYSVYGRNTDTVHIYVMESNTYFGMRDKPQLLPENALFQTTVTW